MTPPTAKHETPGKRLSQPPASDGGEASRGDLYALTGLIVLALLARLPRLTESLWYDEIAAWRDYGNLGPRKIITTFNDPANHIAHTLLTWFSVETLSDTLGQDLSLRLPALIFSLASVFAIYGLARRVGSRRIALIAAALMAVMPVSVLEGAEARGYSMMIFSAAASTWMMLLALDGEGRRRWLAAAAYALLCALGIWAHMVTVFVPIGHATWLGWRLLRHREFDHLIPGMAGLAAGAAVTLAIYSPVLDDIMRIRETFSSAGGDAPSVFGIEGLHTLLQLGGSWYWWAAAPGIMAFLIGLGISIRSRKLRPTAALLLLGLPIIVLTIELAGSWMYARFALFALPGACLVMALGIDAIWHRRRGLCLLLILVLAAGYATDLVIRPPKQPLLDAVEYVMQLKEETDRTLVIGLRHKVMDAYADPLDPQYSLLHGRDLAEKLQQIQPDWVLLMYPESVTNTKYDLLRDQGYALSHRLEGWVDWTNGDVLIYHK